MATRYNYTGGIVTNGLVLNLDAAKVDSYPGTGTTWNDVSGNNNNGTLTNGPTFSGIGKQAAIVFDGVDDYSQISGSALPVGAGDYYVEAWVKRTTVPVNISKGIVSGDSNNAFYFGFGQTYNGTNGLRTGKSNIADAENCAFSFVANTWYHVAITRTSSVIFFYVNAQQQTTLGSGTSGFSFPSSSLAKIGGSGPTINPNSSEYFYGNISAVKIYNRALSAAEVSQNFNALRGRYGI